MSGLGTRGGSASRAGPSQDRPWPMPARRSFFKDFNHDTNWAVSSRNVAFASATSPIIWCPLASAHRRLSQTIRVWDRSFTVNTGAQIFAVGFGTFQNPDAQEHTGCRTLQKGLRLVDTNRVYNGESQVGKGIKNSDIRREDIFLGTKLWCNSFNPNDVHRTLDDSLRELDTPYVDLLMMHYSCTSATGPARFLRDASGRMIHGKTTFVDTWKAMEDLLNTGKVKAIGVLNSSKGEIERICCES